MLALGIRLPVALAASNPINVTHQAAVVHYPNFIDFQLTVSDATSPIGQATLYILYGSPSPTEVQRQVPINKPANTLSLDWHEDISPASGNAQTVGASVEYYWTLQDNIGHTLTVLPQTFTISGFSSNAIIVTSQNDSVHFPQYIDYRMTATDTQSPITQATIFILQNSNQLLAQHTISISKPSNTVTVDWHQETSGSNFITPGSPLSYYWLIQDRASNTHTDAKQQFNTVDTRFSWLSLSQGMMQVHWYNRPQQFGQLLLTQVVTSITHITNILGEGLAQPINLWVYQSPNDFHGALAPNSYEWVGGEAFPSLNEAFISATGADDATLNRDLPHELTHLVFHQHTAIYVPTWFDEGLAVYNQFYHEPDLSQTFSVAVSTNALLRLSDISDGFPSDSNKAYLAYAQSWQLISYMYQYFNQQNMSHLLQSLANTNSNFDGDLSQALGIDESHLENQWHISLNLPPTLAPVQATPTPTPTSPTPSLPGHQTQNLSGASTPILIVLGSLLLVLALATIAILLISQRRKRPAPVAPATAHSASLPFPPNQAQQSLNLTAFAARNGASSPPLSNPGDAGFIASPPGNNLPPHGQGATTPGPYIPAAPAEPDSFIPSSITYREYSGQPRSHTAPQE